MKNIIILYLLMLVSTRLVSQVPEKISYQAVVRDANNNLLTSTTIGMKISVLSGTATGTAVYVEVQKPTTNINGLVSIEVGSGTVLSGNFTTIDWAKGPYFIKTEIDPLGGVNYTISGTSQFITVPYAMYANSVKDDQVGNKVLSFSSAGVIGNSYVLMDTVDIKAGKVVTIKGFVQSTGSECTVYLYDLTNSTWVDAKNRFFTVFDEEGKGFSSFISAGGGTVVPFSTTKKEFTTYFLPTSDFKLEIRAKELTATSANGIGQAAVIVIQ
jgi:hypothetical protein